MISIATVSTAAVLTDSVGLCQAVGPVSTAAVALPALQPPSELTGEPKLSNLSDLIVKCGSIQHRSALCQGSVPVLGCLPPSVVDWSTANHLDHGVSISNIVFFHIHV